MKTDLHIHSKDCSDGKMPLPEVFREADKRDIGIISIADHDSIDCQETAAILASRYGMRYISGVEISISFSHPRYWRARPISLDVLGYQYDIKDRALTKKLAELREYRMKRAEQVVEKLNGELTRAGIENFTREDLEAIEETVNGAFGRPHIADYMVKRRIVATRQEAFERYLVNCNVPKMPVSLEEASELIRGAGGIMVLAHPNDPNRTSLVSLTASTEEQHRIIEETLLPYLDGIECWHSRHAPETVTSYLNFAKQKGLLVTGGSDCHQQPIIMGTVDVPAYVAEQFEGR